MPIYSYCCEACGFCKEALQKLSDPPLVECPECKQATFKKQVTAAGFQLKGSGWYVTDFREGGSSTNKPAATSSPTATPASGAASSGAKPSAD
jgi:putative FmdB family regulatory protein